MERHSKLCGYSRRNEGVSLFEESCFIQVKRLSLLRRTLLHFLSKLYSHNNYFRIVERKKTFLADSSLYSTERNEARESITDYHCENISFFHSLLFSIYSSLFSLHYFLFTYYLRGILLKTHRISIHFVS